MSLLQVFPCPSTSKDNLSPLVLGKWAVQKIHILCCWLVPGKAQRCWRWLPWSGRLGWQQKVWHKNGGRMGKLKYLVERFGVAKLDMTFPHFLLGPGNVWEVSALQRRDLSERVGLVSGELWFELRNCIMTKGKDYLMGCLSIYVIVLCGCRSGSTLEPEVTWCGCSVD